MALALRWCILNPMVKYMLASNAGIMLALLDHPRLDLAKIEKPSTRKMMALWWHHDGILCHQHLYIVNSTFVVMTTLIDHELTILQIFNFLD